MVVARKRSRRLVQGHSNRELLLRVVGSQRDGQVIRLTAAKCTIGSASGCTLRLRAVGVRPIHCLILRGAQGTVVRTCPAGARLNGEEFLDAAIVTGDQLQLGPVTLEVMTPEDGPETFDHDPAASAFDDDETTSPVVEDQETTAERIRTARQRARKLVDAVRTVRGEMALLREQATQAQGARAAEFDLDRQRASDEQDRADLDFLKSKLEQLELELQAQAEQLRAERDSWEQERRGIAADRELAQQSLVAERQSLAGLQESFERDRAAFEREQRERLDQIEQRGGDLERSRHELAELRQQWDAERSQWEQQRSELEQAHQTGHGQIEQLRTLLTNDQQAWSDLQQEQEMRLKDETAGLQAAREELARQQEELQASKSDLDLRSSEFAGREAQCDALQSTSQQRQSELEVLVADLAARESSLTESASQHEQHRAEILQAQSGLADARGELERAHHALDRTRAEVEHDRGQLHEWQARLAEERAEFEAEQQVLAESRAELARSQAEIAAGFEQLLQGHEALESARQQFGEREHFLTAREETVASGHGELSNFRAAWAVELSAWESLQATRHEQLNLRDGELLARERDLAERAHAHEAQTEQLADTQSERDSLQADRDEFARECQEHEARLVDRTNELDQLAAQLDEQRRQLQLDGEAQQARPEILEESNAAFTELEAQLAAARERLAAQEQQLDETLSQCASLSTELEQSRSEFEEQQAEFTDQRASWREQREGPSDETDESASAAARDEEADLATDEQRDSLDEAAPEEFDEEATVRMELSATQELDAIFIEPVDDDECADTDESWRENFRASVASGEKDEDKSIEQCFEELLNRYRKQGSEPAPTTPVKRGKRKSDGKAGKPKQAEPAQAASVDLDQTVEIPVVDRKSPATEFLRRSSGATPNFGAMREVAVSHANLAIGAHGRKRLLRAALVTSSAALGAVFITLIVLGVLAHHYTELRTLANVGWVLGIFWAFVASKAWRQVAAAKQADADGLRENLERLGRKQS